MFVKKKSIQCIFPRLFHICMMMSPSCGQCKNWT